MNGEFNWWLLIVGLVLGAALTWLVMADTVRRDVDITDRERPVEALWIAGEPGGRRVGRSTPRGSRTCCGSIASTSPRRRRTIRSRRRPPHQNRTRPIRSGDAPVISSTWTSVPRHGPHAQRHRPEPQPAMADLHEAGAAHQLDEGRRVGDVRDGGREPAVGVAPAAGGPGERAEPADSSRRRAGPTIVAAASSARGRRPCRRAGRPAGARRAPRPDPA